MSAKPAYSPSDHYLAGKRGEETRRPYLPPHWVTVWMWCTALIVAWDCSFSLLRPASLDAAHPVYSRLYYPYQSKYQYIDMFYSGKTGQLHTARYYAFGEAQSWLNVVEVAMNFLYLFFVHATESPSAVTVGLIVSVATLSKTVLYFMMVSLIGWNEVVPTSKCLGPLLGGGPYAEDQCFDFFATFLIPNGVWIVVPFLVVCALGMHLSTANARFRG